MSSVEGVLEVTEESLAARRPVPWGGVVARLRASEALHRLVPAPLAMAALDLGQRLAVRRRPARLDAGRAAMEAVVGGTDREGELESLAFRHLCASSRGWELMWRPWLLAKMPVIGAEALRDVEPGRGIIFSAPHFGPLAGMAALPTVVGPIHVAVGEHMVAPEAPPGYHGYQNEQVRKILRVNDFRVVRAAGSARTFTQVLKDGGRVMLNLDVPGKTPVQFLGKTVELMSGTARLATTTDSVVFPVVPLPENGKWSVQLGAPLDPRRYDRWEDLLQATVASAEQLILRAPEYLENPLRESGWAVANRDGWRKSA
jgi:lauroyl/myristoyl acyltransferase